VRIVLTLQLWHRSQVMYREKLVGLVCIMNLGGIAMGLQWDCIGIAMGLQLDCNWIAIGLNLGGITMRRDSVGLPKES